MIQNRQNGNCDIAMQQSSNQASFKHKSYEKLCAIHAPPESSASATISKGDSQRKPGEVLPLMDDALLTFLVVGDWGRDGLCCQRDVAIEMSRSAKFLDAAFVISTGDNFYDVGLVDKNDPQVQTSWANVYNKNDPRTATIGSLEWYMALGNHDYRGSVTGQLQLPNSYPGIWIQDGRYWDRVLNLGTDGVNLKVHLIIIDTTPFIARYNTPGWDDYVRLNPDGIMTQDKNKQLQWIETTLKQSTADWKIVVGHHSIWTSGSHSGEDDGFLEATLPPIFEKYGVHMYLSGHDHNLQYSKVGTVSYVRSGAGSKLSPGTYENPRYPGSIFFSSQQGFAVVSLNQHKIELRFVDYAGFWLFQETIADK